MITPKDINERFYKEITRKREEYGSGFNKFLCNETGLSSGYISSILSGNQPGSQAAQIKIAEACNIHYKSLLTENQGKTDCLDKKEKREPAPTESETLYLYRELLKMKDEEIKRLKSELAKTRTEDRDESLGAASPNRGIA